MKKTLIKSGILIAILLFLAFSKNAPYAIWYGDYLFKKSVKIEDTLSIGNRLEIGGDRNTIDSVLGLTKLNNISASGDTSYFIGSKDGGFIPRYIYGANIKGGLPAHNQAASTITSGLLAVAIGGLNNATFTDGQFIIFDIANSKFVSSGYSYLDFPAHTEGTAAPSGGKNGDEYYKTDEGKLYKKLNGSWELIWTAP
jgi:hypothetical protein